MIYIVRHGQTDGNASNKLLGRGSNLPLNEEGIRQAELVRTWVTDHKIQIDKIYSSPLLRAVQTAQILAGSTEMEQDERLLEMDYGPYEGMDLNNPAPEVMAFFSDFVNVSAPEGMERLEDVVSRLGVFLESIKPEAERRNLLLSTHAIAMKGALEYLTPGANGRFWGKYIGNCAVYCFDCRDGGYTVPVEVKIRVD